MKNWIKSKEFPTMLFVVASIATLILFIIIKSLVFANSVSESTVFENKSSDRFYLNEEYDPGDPMITQKLELKDIINGPIITNIEPTLGNFDAPIVIVVYSDYICSFCREQEEVIKQIMNEYEGEIRFVWKDFPEPDVDSISWLSAKAARCTGEQNLYWEYHDKLFSNNEITKDFLLKIAKEIGAENNSFNDCLLDEKYDNIITDNIVEANALGINGIPFMFVNDKEILGGTTYEELKEIIDNELLNVE